MKLKDTQLKQGVDAKLYTSIRIGGKIKFFYLVSYRQEMLELIDNLDDFYLLGGGSNLLIKDSPIEKPVLQLGKNFRYVKKVNNTTIEAGGATSLSTLLRFCTQWNLEGLENLAGIPATIGGLVTMNASSFGREISDCIQEVEVVNKNRKIKKVKKDDIHFGYRTSSLRNSIVLSAVFQLKERGNVGENIDHYLRGRFKKQDFTSPSCGCIFKNPENFSAGFLIDKSHLKGLRKGNAQISSKHANFILNLGKARYCDVDYLIQQAKDSVYKRFAVLLEEEIERWI